RDVALRAPGPAPEARRRRPAASRAARAPRAQPRALAQPHTGAAPAAATALAAATGAQSGGASEAARAERTVDVRRRPRGPEPEVRGPMRAFRHRSSAAFLARAEAWLMRTEVENNVMLGLAMALRERRGSPAPWLVTMESAGEVVACALRTPPRGLLLSRAAPDALECLLDELASEAGSLPSAIGPEPTAGDFARLWSRAWGRPARARVRQRLYELRRVLDAGRAEGRLRP